MTGSADRIETGPARRGTTPWPRGGRSGTLAAALAGVVAAAASIATGELIAGIVPGAPSLVLAIGNVVIALQPPGAKDVMVGLFGANDKLALNLLVVAAALLIAAFVGVRARRSFTDGAVAFAAFGLVALAAALAVPQEPGALGVVLAAATAMIAAAAGIVALRRLLRLVPPAAVAGDVAPGRGAPRGAGPGRPEPMPDWDRRRFLLTGGALLAVSGVVGVAGRALLERRHPSGTTAEAALPPLPSPPPSLAPDQSLNAPAITPIVTPNDHFYRIDTELLVPQVDASGWQLKVDGMVAHPLTFDYAQLLAMPQIEQYVTIACVSNDVGGNLVGNALWRGARLKEILASAGVDPRATQIVGRAVDGFTVGFPTAWALDPAREPMVAVGMNGKPLPTEHGYPARLIVPGLYGYVSATKWLAEIQLTTREAFDAYWVQLGWAKDGPILTQSRIDHPHDGDHVAPGQAWIDGVAWAPDRGVSKVELSIDGGPWQATQTSRPISKATWVQWMLQWQATPGRHTIEVRATDGTGTVQTAQETNVSPDGARGHMRIAVTVG